MRTSSNHAAVKKLKKAFSVNNRDSLRKTIEYSKQVNLILIKRFRHKQETRLNIQLNYQGMSTENSC